MIGSTWVYKTKRHKDNTIQRFKARLCGRGFAQVLGVNYLHTYSPTAHHATMRVGLALSAEKGWSKRLLDVSTAFLNADADTEILMELPEGFFSKQEREKWVIKVTKAIYGLKQSGRLWWKELSSWVKSIGFTVSETDACLITRKNDLGFIAAVLHVDDLIIFGDEAVITDFRETIKKRYKIGTDSPLDSCLGCEITNHADGSISLSQCRYARDVLKGYGYEGCTFRKTGMSPTPVNKPFIRHSEEEIEEERKRHPYMYWSVSGALRYLETMTRPDLSFATSLIASAATYPGPTQWEYVDHLLRYLESTKDYGITYRRLGDDVPVLECCVDASYADTVADPEHGRTSYGWVIFLSGGPIAWSCKKMTVQAGSTVEAEYYAAKEASNMVLFLRAILEDFGCVQKWPTPMFEDNDGAILLAMDPILHSRARHIHQSVHILRQRQGFGQIQMTPINTLVQPADIMTKCHGPQKFMPLRDMVVSPVTLGYQIANALIVEYQGNQDYDRASGMRWLTRRKPEFL